VSYIEPIRGIGGGHGAMLLWQNDTTTPAGYTLPGGAAQGSIAAGAAVRSQPITLQMPLNELLQFRFVMKLLAPGAGPVLDDIDVQIYLPSAVGRMQVLNDQGRYNALYQFQAPGDIISTPAQNANITLPAAFPVKMPVDANHYTELFTYESQTPVFFITNNGSAATAAGSALALYVFGYRYVLTPSVPDTSWTSQDVLGQPLSAPPDWLPVPIGGRGR
jgi:hypothetical protein